MTSSYFDFLLELPTLLILVFMALFTALVGWHWARRLDVSGVGEGAALAAAVTTALLVFKMMRDPVLVADQFTWHTLAVEVSRYLTGERGQSVQYVEGKEGYLWILGGLYAVSAPAPVVGVGLNICLVVFLCLTVSSCTKLICTLVGMTKSQLSAAVRVASFGIALAPGTLLWTPALLRETLTMLAYSVALLSVLLYVARPSRVAYLVLTAASVATLWTVRSSTGVVLAATCLFALLWVAVSGTRLKLAIRTLLIVVLAVILALNWSVFQAELQSTVEDRSDTTAELSEIASSGFPGLGWSNDLVGILSITAPRVLWGPLPWELNTSPVMLLALVEGIFWIGTTLLALLTVYKLRNCSGRTFFVPIIIIFVSLFLVGLMMTVGNYGILARFRSTASVVLFPLAAMYFALRNPVVSPKVRPNVVRVAGGTRSLK